ncbi:MAG: 7,8-dihydroneopterin aldolase/epimerase/oxygenase [Gaiellaceae bacterium]|nr:7,8-dihydroneopterin aldolase/epimerase/oxygenase [Gaiellaceae bacterium]
MSGVLVEIVGLEVFGHHGVYEEERSAGQLFLFDLELEVPHAAVLDELSGTVDYDAVAACVARVSGDRQFRLLEGLASAVVDAILDSFPVERIRVRVRKPGIRPGGLGAEYTAASVERSRPTR